MESVENVFFYRRPAILSLWYSRVIFPLSSSEWGRQKENNTKKDQKKENAEKIKHRKDLKEKSKMDKERMAVVARDLKASPGGIAGTGVGAGKSDLIEAIREEQKKLKLLVNVDPRKKPSGLPYERSSAARKEVSTTDVREKESSPRKPMSETMSQKELVDIFGSAAEIPTDQVFADLEKEGIFLLKKKNARFPKVRFSRVRLSID